MRAPVRRRRHSSRGASLVEFALIAPLLIVLVLAIVEFGVGFSDMIQTRQGVRDAARLAAVGDFGASGACGLESVSGSSTQAARLLCQTRSAVSVDGARAATCLRDLSAPSVCSADTETDYSVGNTLVVCAMIPVGNLTGLFPFLDDRVVTDRIVIRIEQLETTRGPSVEADDFATATESALAGHDWGFCVPG